MKKIFILNLILILSFCSSNNEIQKKIKKEIENISPETAIIKVEILSSNSSENFIKVKFKVIDVYAYGSSMTPINNETIFENELDKRYFEKNKFYKGNNLVVEIQSIGEEMFGNNENNKWIIKRVLL
ncbi:MAG: hypothetical protein N2321_04590 [Melioribacteraceae bacterium]|nr:hypothetical protein [Melioribacteraceae bacterium]